MPIESFALGFCIKIWIGLHAHGMPWCHAAVAAVLERSCWPTTCQAG
jgi:hypothetical protein